jgi:hypothetical protein
MSRQLPVIALLSVLACTSASLVMAQQESPQAVLQRASDAMACSKAGDRVLHYQFTYSDSQNYQSERTYPPYIDLMTTVEAWFSPRSGVLRTDSQQSFPGIRMPKQTALYADHAGVNIAQDHATRIPQSELKLRNLNAWAVLYDWMHTANVHVVGRENYRDYPRIVLARATAAGDQRLFLDPKSGLPVKLDYTEAHYLWGQRHIEYVYGLWQLQQDLLVNAAAFRLADGELEISATLADGNVIANDPALKLQMPALSEPVEIVPLFLRPTPPKIVQVTPTTYLLSNRGFTEAVTLAGNEIYIFDATQGDERARQDAAEIARLFPGKHKINLVVTDLAWPHVAGVRYWVAQNATIIAHPAARAFLQAVVNRRWTLHPDALEKNRKSSQFHFVAVDHKTSFGTGKVELAPIDGIGSETVLMGFIPADHFLWSSDYIQTLSEPSQYAKEVLSAVRREGWQPQQAAAEHVALFEWNRILQLLGS